MAAQVNDLAGYREQIVGTQFAHTATVIQLTQQCSANVSIAYPLLSTTHNSAAASWRRAVHVGGEQYTIINRQLGLQFQALVVVGPAGTCFVCIEFASSQAEAMLALMDAFGMRPSTLLLALPALSAAQQVPFLD